MKMPNLSLRLNWSLVLVSFITCIYTPRLMSLSTTPTFGNETDRLALLAFKNYLIDGPSEALRSWNASLHFCQWLGVTCGRRHQRVTVLSLRDKGLAGFLPPPIGNLTFLREVDFSSNKLQGTIPKEIGLLFRLQNLNLSSNFIGGEIPVELTNCSNLEKINLAYNNLTGDIPSEVRLLPKLLTLWLRVNSLTGSIPSPLGNITTLQRLSLSRNSLEGYIPHELGRLKGLVLLQLVDNNLSGMLPSSLYNLSSIVELSIANNHFSGALEPDMGLKFPNLQFFTISNNQFTGRIPSTLSNISGLVTFSVSSNNLTGQLPDSLGMLKNLQFLNVGHNGLGSGKSGDLTFFNSLINASNLATLSLKSNHFGGSLPNSFVNLTQISSLALGTNEISGSIPEGIGNLINLVGFGIEENYLTSIIPSSIGKLQNLEVLALGSNRLSGVIPSSLGSLTRMFALGLENNTLEGSIPSSLKNCKTMQQLFLAQNQLSGSIPEGFFGQFDQLITLDLHENSLTGSFPQEVGNLKNLREIYISDNKLSGEIPGELGDCLVLEYLDMANNRFDGNIPTSLSSLKAIQVLDLSHNNLSGKIPRELEDLSVLQNLNLSFNHLEGEVPTGGVFRNVSVLELNGNKNLCGGIAQLKLPTCSNLESEKHVKPLSTGVIIAIASSGVLCLLALVVGFVVLYRKRKPKRKSSSTSSLGDGYFKVSYGELLKATDGFSSSHLIGMGSFGSVYKGIVGEDDRPVAVKVLNLQKHGASKSFMAECRALGKIRHRNLLKIITSCSSADFKGNEFMALVFEFMPNGSLEKWLHESRNLSFGQRLDIAIDVASAVEYLHHHCDTFIVHCDLKPSNVLLDNDMVAHVGDFGLARLLHEVTGNSSTNQSISSTIKGSVGYVAPEYGMGRKVSTQGDVYSFGILLLELVTGRRPTDDRFKDGMTLHSFCKMAMPERAREIMDSYLLKEFKEFTDSNGIARYMAHKMWECLFSITEIGVACSEEHAYERMNMKDALRELHVIKKMFLQEEIHGEAHRRWHPESEGTSYETKTFEDHSFQ